MPGSTGRPYAAAIRSAVSRRAPDRDPRLWTVGVVAAQHVVAAEVRAVVGVQVAEEHRVDGQRVGVPLEGTESAGPEVEQHPPGATGVVSCSTR